MKPPSEISRGSHVMNVFRPSIKNKHVCLHRRSIVELEPEASKGREFFSGDLSRRQISLMIKCAETNDLCFASLFTCCECAQELSQQDGEARMRAVLLRNQPEQKEKDRRTCLPQVLTTRRRQNLLLNLTAIQPGHVTATLSQET